MTAYIIILCVHCCCCCCCFSHLSVQALTAEFAFLMKVLKMYGYVFPYKPFSVRASSHNNHLEQRHLTYHFLQVLSVDNDPEMSPSKGQASSFGIYLSEK